MKKKKTKMKKKIYTQSSVYVRIIFYGNRKKTQLVTFLLHLFFNYIVIHPPFSSGGGLFAFSIEAIKESNIFAIKRCCY
jgi:hypothetical protein